MKTWTGKLEAIIEKIVSIFLGLVVVLLLVITLAQVAVRYLFNVSLGGLEELPMYLMIVGIWVGAVLLSKDDTHLRLDGIGMIVTNKKALKIIGIPVDMISAVAMYYCGYLMLEYTNYCIQQGMITSGMGIPIYYFAAIIAICIILMGVFKTIRVIRHMVEVFGREHHTD